MGLLGGVDQRVQRRMIRRIETEMEEEETEIGKEEFEKIIRKIKGGGKAMGRDGKKYGGEEIKKWTRAMCNRVWRGKG